LCGRVLPQPLPLAWRQLQDELLFVVVLVPNAWLLLLCNVEARLPCTSTNTTSMERPIQAAVLNRLGHLRRGDLRQAVQVGYGP
jgi:hypothetical protein